MAKSDLGYLNGLIASMYKTLIPRDKLLRFTEAEPEEIFRALKEQGYAGEADSARDYQVLLENEKEKLALVQEVLSRDDIRYCPHGRPVCIRLTRAQLERQFKRA